MLRSTPRSPRTPDSQPRAIKTIADIKTYLDDVSSRGTWFSCPRCEVEWNCLSDRGICIACIDQEVADDRHQRELGKYLADVLGKYGIERYSFATFEQTPGNLSAFEAALRFDWKAQNLFLWGDPGCGKTHLAGAILKTACAKNLTVKWVNPMYLGMALHGRFPQDQKAFIDDIARHDVVIFDDLGVGDDLKMTLKILYMVCDRRLADKINGLVVTSNLRPELLAKAMKDDRVMSRLIGLCRGNIYSLAGRDMRVA